MGCKSARDSVGPSSGQPNSGILDPARITVINVGAGDRRVRYQGSRVVILVLGKRARPSLGIRTTRQDGRNKTRFHSFVPTLESTPYTMCYCLDLGPLWYITYVEIPNHCPNRETGLGSEGLTFLMKCWTH
ncbi:hypothetical protein RSAG8_10265, partial [Rhizoctonia solani AG-8 WAC10335]